MSYSHAFHCSACPETNSPKGCPAWVELVLTNPSGDTKIEKSCVLQQLPMLMVEVIKASNRPAAAIESVRENLNTVLQAGFSALNTSIQQAVQDPVQNMMTYQTLKEITHGK